MLNWVPPGGNAMQWNQAQSIPTAPDQAWKRRNFSGPQSVLLDKEIVEKGAQALFEFVFSGLERLDGKQLWTNCSEETRAGFRAEAKAVLEGCGVFWAHTIASRG